ncbi:MAG: hypothetical protein ACHQVS_04270 [Candidatus Babeliales bacterium]
MNMLWISLLLLSPLLYGAEHTQKKSVKLPPIKERKTHKPTPKKTLQMRIADNGEREYLITVGRGAHWVTKETLEQLMPLEKFKRTLQEKQNHVSTRGLTPNEYIRFQARKLLPEQINSKNKPEQKKR